MLLLVNNNLVNCHFHGRLSKLQKLHLENFETALPCKNTPVDELLANLVRRVSYVQELNI